MTSGELDAEKLASSVISHPSGVDVVPAPVRPEDAELVAEDRVGRLLDVARECYDAVIVDTPAFFQATTLATLDRTDRLLLVASLDIPTVKNVKLTLQTLSLLHYPKDRIHLVLNRSGQKSRLKRGEVEKALDLKVAFEVPNDHHVPDSLDRGIPVPLASPRSGVTKALSDMAAAMLTAPAKDEKAAPTGRGRGRGGQARRSVVKLRKAA
jgi:pilus assembly protein CpaE